MRALYLFCVFTWLLAWGSVPGVCGARYRGTRTSSAHRGSLMLKHRHQLAAALALAASAVLVSAGAAAAGTTPQARHAPALAVRASRLLPAGVTQPTARAVAPRGHNPAVLVAQQARTHACAARSGDRASGDA